MHLMISTMRRDNGNHVINEVWSYFGSLAFSFVHSIVLALAEHFKARVDTYSIMQLICHIYMHHASPNRKLITKRRIKAVAPHSCSIGICRCPDVLDSLSVVLA